ncbi:MAG: hypothetical protein BMS9Abin33_0959 [Gammaproteobacteria bacterium]|nr:MAG: hypothetical protein BMS9Abin33_0959 [Gammaproteobacteria bacterium]
MFLTHKPTGDVVEIIDHQALSDPFKSTVSGQFHAGEELQEPADFDKNQLVFPSGEALPRCWLDPEYRKLDVA